MDDEVQTELICVAKEALTCLSCGRRDEDLIYRLRDVIRKAEGKFGTDALNLHLHPDDLHRA